MSDTEGKQANGMTGGGRAWLMLGAAAALMAGCAGAPGPKPSTDDKQTACGQAAAGDAWVGNWLAVDKRKGIAGELHVQMTLNQDGSMVYAEQLKRSGKPNQTLNETGRWQRAGETLVMRTTHSNAVAVEQGDPIYTNEYEVQLRGGQMVLNGPEGPLGFKRMPGDYRLPVF